MNKDNLEAMIDKLGVYGVLDMVQTIAYEKADHIDHNWQDSSLAKRWRKAASLISTLEFKVSKLLP